MRARPVLILAVSLVSLALAGCIEIPGAGTSDVNDTSPSGGAATTKVHSASGPMTATERREDATSGCGGGSGACALRRVTVTGDVTSLQSLEVELRTVNGQVKLVGGEGTAWRMVATLSARGGSQEQAQRALEDLRFTWDHEEGGQHFLEAVARFEGRHPDVSRSASIEVTLPRSLLLRVVADTTNGGIDVSGVRTDGLAADTTNGGIRVDAEVAQVDLSTTNGDVEAWLRPTASGRISLETTNGGISLEVPEDAQRGYDLEGSTTNGVVEIRLRDGTLGPCPQGSQYYTPPCNHRTFKTGGYDARAVKSQVTLETTNGGVTVSPA